MIVVTMLQSPRYQLDGRGKDTRLFTSTRARATLVSSCENNPHSSQEENRSIKQTKYIGVQTKYNDDHNIGNKVRDIEKMQDSSTLSLQYCSMHGQGCSQAYCYRERKSSMKDFFLQEIIGLPEPTCYILCVSQVRKIARH